MTIFYFNLVVVYVFSLCARYFSKVTSNFSVVAPNKIPATIALTSLVVIAGLRNNIGDTFFYMHSYKLKHFTLGDIDFSGDFGFDLYQMILQRISRDPQILVLITALITNVLIVVVLYRYSRLFEISLFVYITAGSYLVSMNGIRQFLAASIIFGATKYIMNGDWKKYIFIILIASTIHKSALVLIPIYFIVRSPAWSKITLLLILGSIFIVFGFNQFSSVLFSAIEDTQYGHYSNFQEGGANILRVIITAVPIVIAYIGREKLKLIFPKSDYIVNMSIISLVFMLISTQNWIFARFDIYFGLYNLILISWVVKLFSIKDQKLIYLSILVCYFILYIFEQSIGMGIIYKSVYINL
ncbi:EpsG family protein [Falsibacillus pallidus]|uniref:Transmembrane protein EpsG n=1 Tax=Falsibacillus pallidus TaxID=493781 RepID=A0A370GQM7_9BACI|nr:EpsG family protein [Falsibacillus pallidus]RDI45709.1 transmembrane protein EpsG [Falsibacillus pallidus]